MAKYYSIVRISRISLIHSFVDGHLDRFHLLAVVNEAAVNTGEEYLPRSCFHFFWSAIPGSCVSYVHNLLRKDQVVFHSGFTIVIFPPAIHESSNISISSLTLIL